MSCSHCNDSVSLALRRLLSLLLSWSPPQFEKILVEEWSRPRPRILPAPPPVYYLLRWVFVGCRDLDESLGKGCTHYCVRVGGLQFGHGRLCQSVKGLLHSVCHLVACILLHVFSDNHRVHQ